MHNYSLSLADPRGVCMAGLSNTSRHTAYPEETLDFESQATARLGQGHTDDGHSRNVDCRSHTDKPPVFPA